jgi:hypothetical protein
MKHLVSVAVVLLLSIGSACSSKPGGSEAAREPNAASGSSGTKNLLEQLAGNCSIDEFKMAGIREEPSLGQVLFAHPMSECSLEVDPAIRFVRFRFGIFDTASIAVPKTDGVGFAVLIRNAAGHADSVWSRSLDPVTRPSDRGPQQAVLAINPKKGDRLVFQTLTGASYQNDWAYWSKVSLDRDLDSTQLLGDNKLRDQFGVSGIRSNGQLGEVVFAHPSSQFQLPILTGVQSVAFRFGVLEEARVASPPTDGVEFRVLLKTTSGLRQIWSRRLQPATVATDRGTHDGTVKINPKEAESLIFETLPIAKWENDWAYWSGVKMNFN